MARKPSTKPATGIKAPAAPKAAPVASAAAVAPKPDTKGRKVTRADEYHEIPTPCGGVMRCEAGDYIITEDDSVTVMPPSVFAEAFPDEVE